MKNIIITCIFFLAVSASAICQEKTKSSGLKPGIALEKINKPYARYWWFASMIKEQDIRYNLDWLKANGFGGVEIAWVYPLNRFNKNDTTYTPRQEWLSPEWTKIVEYAVKFADSIGLGCDLTFGTLWPFGDTQVPFEHATQKFGDSSWRQEISRSWEHPRTGYVIDHLTPKNYLPYFNRLMNVFPHPNTKLSQNYFIDSWEVETEKLWCKGFDIDFKKKFGYDITPYMDSIYCDYNKHYLYDYMTLLSDKVLKFYKDYDSTMNVNKVFSRGQVSGAPCDLISGYALLDIPEGESMLFEPEFNTIPASAALLTNKKVVSAETFTCLYGWPRDYIREEQTADLKLVADALFANGINHIIWHGKPHNPKDCDTVNFYATTHIGFSGSLAEEIPQFNKYLETVSDYMKRGFNFSDIAVYLPTEDAWITGVMPKEKQFIWAWGYYEMRYVYFPNELAGYNPVWINYEFLKKASVTNNHLRIGNVDVEYLYVDAKYLDYKVIKRLIELADDGLKIILKQEPIELNLKYNKFSYLNLFLSSKNILHTLPENFTPFISGSETPVHWVRKDNDVMYIFFPNPKSRRLKFPMEYGQSLNTETFKNDITINYDGKSYNLNLTFEPYQSLLYKLENGKFEQIDIKFVPKTPVVKRRTDDYVAPWFVK
ncbi:MAG: glycosyl hydrolase [bacterium]